MKQNITKSDEKLKIKSLQREEIYKEAIETNGIEMITIRSLAFQGIPEGLGFGLRATYWKLLLNYLPLKKSDWEESLKLNRQTYRTWVKEVYINPREQQNKNEEEEDIDHPLSVKKTSKWNTFFKDNQQLNEIDKDVQRTLQNLSFFHQESNYEALRRILFVYAKLNPGIGYVQGMNEVLAVLYYVFAKDDPQKEIGDDFILVEADTFFCFTTLMSEIMNFYCKSLDNTEMGINAEVKKLENLLKVKDKELWSNLDEKGLHANFYSYRWLMLLLSQEFVLPDVLRLWDSFLSDEKRFKFLIYFCCSMILNVKDKIMPLDFGEALKILQEYPVIDIQPILKMAEEMRIMDKKKQIY
eukprot:TRINITY_DN15916_c0_g1_i1.p1 TRINITY_DN15916_c0_g1~~TRINITY_DN15916_c0_g1_i1.p1  ORF type:complete len:355 (+),score=74.85 TRINITY_DN15916_c0_g1_i1:42-1106(+)